jgi:glycosyltransferase involved in cell wall biosynthesis
MKTATADEPQAPALHALIVNSVLTGGGVDSHTVSLCAALMQAGVQVTLAAPGGARLLAQARTLPGLQLLELPQRRQRWPLRLARHVRRHAVQVIHAHHGRDYWVAVLAGWLSAGRARVVVTRHLMTALKAKTRWLLAPPCEVIAVSDAVLGAVRQGDPGQRLRVTRVHCGIDTEVFRPRPEWREAARAELGFAPGDVCFVVIGPTQAPDGKGQFYFAAAAAQVLAQAPQARFLCVGDGNALPALRDEADRLGLGGRFTILPFSDQVPRLLQAVDVLVHPAVHSEALGLVILEALACAKPVVASRLDGISETFRDGEHGRLVPPRDVPALAAALLEVADDAGLRQRRGLAGRQWVQANFSLQQLGRQTRQVYEAERRQAGAAE